MCWTEVAGPRSLFLFNVSSGYSVNTVVRRVTETRNKLIARQFKLTQLFVAIACVAFVFGARSIWLSFKNPSIPHIAPILLGCVIAVIAERAIRNFAIVLLLACTVATLQFAIYSWESMQNSERRDFPHVITYHYSGDLDLHVIAGIVVLIGTLVLGGGLAAFIRYLRNNNTQ
jgi:hypothetical protein